MSSVTPKKMAATSKTGRNSTRYFDHNSLTAAIAFVRDIDVRDIDPAPNQAIASVTIARKAIADFL